jgi:hypothetical protein
MYHADGRFKRLAVSAQAHRDRTRHSKADVISFSGCKDSETSADTTEGGLSVGAMSYVRLSYIHLSTENDTVFIGFHDGTEDKSGPDVRRPAPKHPQDLARQV